MVFPVELAGAGLAAAGLAVFCRAALESAVDFWVAWRAGVHGDW